MCFGRGEFFREVSIRPGCIKMYQSGGEEMGVCAEMLDSAIGNKGRDVGDNIASVANPCSFWTASSFRLVLQSCPLREL